MAGLTSRRSRFLGRGSDANLHNVADLAFERGAPVLRIATAQRHNEHGLVFDAAEVAAAGGAILGP